VPDIDLNGGWSDLGPVDPEQGRVLAERLRFAVESLNDEFEGLSKSDAERLIFQAAQEVLSAASVVQFVPTFAERRARQILHGGLPSATGPSLDLITTPESDRHDGEESVGPSDTPNAGLSMPAPASQFADEPAPTPTPPAPPATLTPADSASAPRWPDDFYATEAKRLLEKARLLRATDLDAEPEG
jgi:hypothetical protein